MHPAAKSWQQCRRYPNSKFVAGTTKPDFKLMVTGHYVFLRYMEEGADDPTVNKWQRVMVQRQGHYSETARGDGCVDPEMVGWFCIAPPHVCLFKFFLKSRILDINICI